MYKFPVTKNGREYGVSVCKNYLFNDVYDTKLYKRIRVLCFTFNHKLRENHYSYDAESKKYKKLLENKELYKHLAKIIIDEYEEDTYKENLIYDNEQAYCEWDGVL